MAFYVWITGYAIGICMFILIKYHGVDRFDDPKKPKD